MKINWVFKTIVLATTLLAGKVLCDSTCGSINGGPAKCGCWKNECWSYKTEDRTAQGDPWCYLAPLGDQTYAGNGVSCSDDQDCSWEMFCKDKQLYTGEGNPLTTQGQQGVNGLYQKTFNWNDYPDGDYQESTAKSDFGVVNGWNSNRAYISSGSVRVKLEKDSLSAGGMIVNVDLPPGTAYELDFDVTFAPEFIWSKGGKVGFGFGIGNGYTGCNPATDGNGGTLRLMWYGNRDNRVYFQPYLYYKDMPGRCGDTFGKSYPSSGSLNKGQWYHIHLYIKSNTGSNKDGHAQVKIDNDVVLDMPIRWTTNDSKRQINKLTFHTFRGGSQSYWKSSTDDYIFYDNLIVRQIE